MIFHDLPFFTIVVFPRLLSGVTRGLTRLRFLTGLADEGVEPSDGAVSKIGPRRPYVRVCIPSVCSIFVKLTRNIVSLTYKLLEPVLTHVSTAIGSSSAIMTASHVVSLSPHWMRHCLQTMKALQGGHIVGVKMQPNQGTGKALAICTKRA